MLRGILTIEEARVLWVFRQTVYPTRNPVPEQEVNRRIYAAIANETGAVDERTAALIAILHNCRALGMVLPKEALKQSLKRIEDVCASTPAGAAVGKAVATVLAENEAAASAAMTGAILAAASG